MSDAPVYPLRCNAMNRNLWMEWQCAEAATHFSPPLGHFVCGEHAGFTCRPIRRADMSTAVRVLLHSA